jgi:uncharacterized membrane protein YbhN (UPF0104 family)
MSPRARAALRIALALALLAALLWWVDPRALWPLLAGADPLWLALGLGAAVAANAASALRWWLLARWLGAGVSPGWALVRYFHGVAINAVLPGAVVGGDLYRAHALTRAGLPAMEAGVAVLGDRVGGLWVLVVLGALAAAWGLAAGGGAAALGTLGLDLAGHGPALLAGAAALGLLLPLALLLAWRHGLRPAAAAPLRWPARLARLAQRPRAPAQYGWQVLGSVVVQLLSVGALLCAGQAIGVDLPAWAWAVAAVPVFLLAALPIGFGGWGTREAAAVLTLAAFGVGAAEALVVALLYGLAALLQALAVAAAGGLRALRGGAR